MAMRIFKNQKGFTLIELVVVIAILGILALIAVPRFITFQEQARLKTDLANVRILNSVTPMYRWSLLSEDPFMIDGKAPEQLIDILVNEGFLISMVEAQSKDAEVAWDFETERWYLDVQGELVFLPTDSSYFMLHSSNNNRITGYDVGGGKNPVIPDEISGTVITEISGSAGQGAFQDKEIESVLLPAGIEIIGNHAFRNNSLTSIAFPEGLTSIGIHSFGDNQITEVVIPASLISVGESAFHDNPITKITIGEGVEIGGSYSFGSNRAPTHFKTVYEMPSGGAGTYLWDGTTWVKQSD